MNKMLFIINSEQRDNGTESDFNYSINYYQINQVQQFRINKITVPASWYNIRAQTFRITQGGFGAISINIPGGSYTANSLITKLTNLINPNLVGATLTITYDSDTNKFNFVMSAGTILFDFLFDNTVLGQLINYNLGYQLGFFNYSTPQNPAAFANITAPFSADLNSTYNLYLSSPTLNLYNVSLFNRIKANIIQSIPVNTNSFGFVIWQNNLETVFDLDNTSLNSLSFQLLDDYNNIVDLNGCGIIIELQLYGSF